MKILAISDEVVPQLYNSNIETRYADVDLVLSCGDLPPYYLEFIVTVLNVPLYYVKGNHDHEPRVYTESKDLLLPDISKALPCPGGCVNVDGRVVEHKGLLIAGLEGSMRYKPGPYQYTQNEMMHKVARLGTKLFLRRILKGRWVDILITHAAPFEIHDGKDHCHTGFRAFLGFMRRYKPQYLIHGHSHVYDRRQPRTTRYGETLVVNAHPYRIIEIDDPGSAGRR
ncbi:MAG: metallophosphoesterase [Anaerolineae bacterium]|nr:metallophosphoesterase [Anaerolineae bacterium]